MGTMLFLTHCHVACPRWYELAQKLSLLFSETDLLLNQPVAVFGSCFNQTCLGVLGLTVCLQACNFPQNLR
ncbi:MAG: hypothetical protein JO202_17260 [Ktedonobacteraceae bacterium]|nr:hypothetical protein [Ktedonobacteraceae bacterium]